MRVIKKIFASKIQQTFPYILIIGAIIGLFASLTLTVEHIDLIKNPDHHLSCSLDPVLSCGPVINSHQAEAFGFPNPLIGLSVFGAQLLLGFVMLAGGRMKSWFWKFYAVGMIAGLAFTLWLMFQTLFRINALCIYCMSVWTVMFTTAWYLVQYMIATKQIKVKNTKFIKFIREHHFDILLAWFLIVAATILHHFWYFYGPKLGF